MPQLTVEYTGNLTGFDASKTLNILNSALAASGHFKEADIKGRAIKLEHFRIGTQPEGRALIFAKLAILSGRSPEIKKRLSAMLLEGLKKSYTHKSKLQVQFCAEIVDMDRDSYMKENMVIG